MTCEELKNKILNKDIDDSLLICVYKDTAFVINQYINQISKIKDLTKVYVDSLDEITADSNAFFGTNQNVLYVFNTDKLECSSKLLNYKNTIVVCKEVANEEVCKNNVVNIPALTKDQILEYMELTCPSINENKLEWLFLQSSGDIYRIDNELNKLKLFTDQESIFNLLKQESGYNDLNNSTIFDLVNAFIRKDTSKLLAILNNLDVIDVEGTGLITVLIKNIKNIITIQNPKATPESTKMTEKQFKAVSYNKGKFTITQLADMLDFLTSLDYKLKSGSLELTNKQLVGYILTNIIDIGWNK